MSRPFGYGPSPNGWRPTRLRSFLTRRKRTGHQGLPLLSVNLPSGVVLRQEGDGRPAPSIDMSAYQLVKPGDLVMNQLGKPHGSLGVSEFDGIISPAYFVAEIGPSAEPRFVHHLLRTRLYISEYERRGKFMPPSQFDISWDQFRQIEVLLPPLAEQRAIADYLDTETTRIDTLITKKRKLIEAVDARFWSWAAASITDRRPRMVPLRRFIERIVDGPFGSSLTSSHYVDTGARVVRLGNIGFAEFKDSDRAFITMDHFAGLQRHRVFAGDLLIAGLGDSRNHVGRACVAPNLGDCLVKADCYCARPDTSLAYPEFLALYLSSPIGAEQVALAARGTTRSRINLDIAKEILVPQMAMDEQRAIVDGAEVSRSRTTRAVRSLSGQIDLLAEHRQALITAAVTGESVVPGVAA